MTAAPADCPARSAPRRTDPARPMPGPATPSERIAPSHEHGRGAPATERFARDMRGTARTTSSSVEASSDAPRGRSVTDTARKLAQKRAARAGGTGVVARIGGPSHACSGAGPRGPAAASGPGATAAPRPGHGQFRRPVAGGARRRAAGSRPGGRRGRSEAMPDPFSAHPDLGMVRIGRAATETRSTPDDLPPGADPATPGDRSGDAGRTGPGTARARGARRLGGACGARRGAWIAGGRMANGLVLPSDPYARRTPPGAGASTSACGPRREGGRTAPSGRWARPIPPARAPACGKSGQGDRGGPPTARSPPASRPEVAPHGRPRDPCAEASRAAAESCARPAAVEAADAPAAKAMRGPP